ncbi:hypothetical protein HPCPY1313_1459 [Helicobacter pylori CPY1313]|nr:hypothetical protein HPCPY1313_1459 [Helicobacter pylori CPY1313]
MEKMKENLKNHFYNKFTTNQKQSKLKPLFGLNTTIIFLIVCFYPLNSLAHSVLMR